ncbi:MAG: ABC transporter permease subunit, partial [Oscillospiraceae bacterium]|nr:ABC transporter permease subunit [Oscillospiraceae bacterium]
ADVEEIVSPMRQIVNNFLSRKLAVGAMVLLIAMFITMFVGPLFMPKYSDSYTDVTQQNIAPTMKLATVPGALKNNIKMIDGYGSFTVGLSNDGYVYVWGSTAIGTTGVDVSEIPADLPQGNIAMVAAGIDHVVAIDNDGKIWCWGNKKLGQYGTEAEVLAAGGEISPNIAYFPQELADNGIELSEVKKLTCGYQASAILMNDGTLHLWGNKNVYKNFDLFLSAGSMYDMDFTLNYIVGVNGRRNTIYTGSRGLYDVVRPNVGAQSVKIATYLDGRTIEEIVTTNNSLALVLSDGDICFAGDFTADAVAAPKLAADEHYVDVVGGANHYTGLTNKGNVYTWGRNNLDQCEMPSKTTGVSQIFRGSNQSYAVGEGGKLLSSWGLKGYLFGTDTRGADIFQRIINGGKMTMTIGAIAVIISSIIGIVVGCIAGYFGGKVDILLMRVAEIFNAIPFLPFAMILSAVMGRMTLTENTRIFIIMVILGVLTWSGLARLVRGQVLVVRESEYVTAAKAMGVKENVIAFKHILPNVMSVILVNLMLNFGTCMLTESSLSYLGFGVAYPRPTWGNMLNGANNATIINAYWWQWVFTAAFLAVTTICINIVGDALRDVMDPKSSVEK